MVLKVKTQSIKNNKVRVNFFQNITMILSHSSISISFSELTICSSPCWLVKVHVAHGYYFLFHMNSTRCYHLKTSGLA